MHIKTITVIIDLGNLRRFFFFFKMLTSKIIYKLRILSPSQFVKVLAD